VEKPEPVEAAVTEQVAILTPFARKKSSLLLLERVLAQLITELLYYLDVRSSVTFLGLFVRGSHSAPDSFVEPTFLPSLPFRRVLVQKALLRTGIAFYTMRRPKISFGTKMVPLRAISAAVDGLRKLPAEMAPQNMAFLRDTELCERQMARSAVTVPIVTDPYPVKLVLPCKRCPVACTYEIDGGTRQGPCARTVFWSCASCKELCMECQTHCETCTTCEKNVCVDCIVEDYDACRSCTYYTCVACGDEELLHEDAWECEGRTIHGRELPCQGNVKCCADCADEAGVSCCTECGRTCCIMCVPSLRCLGCGKDSCLLCYAVRVCLGCQNVVCEDCDTCGVF
jgi:hypothetical protein